MFQKVECPRCSGWDKREKNFKSGRELGALSSTGSSNGESWRGKEMSSLGHERCHTAWHSTYWVQNIRHLPGTDGRASSNNSQGRILSKCILGFGLEAATVNYTLAVRVQKGTVPVSVHLRRVSVKRCTRKNHPHWPSWVLVKASISYPILHLCTPLSDSDDRNVNTMCIPLVSKSLCAASSNLCSAPESLFFLIQTVQKPELD